MSHVKYIAVDSTYSVCVHMCICIGVSVL